MKRLFVPGVFDVFHVGHLNYLRRAADAGDYIIVGVQDDRAVNECKGVHPIIPLAERMAIVEALRFVDEVVSYTKVFQGPLLRGLEIDVLAVGEEYGADEQYPDQRRTLDFCRDQGIEVVHIPRTNHVSSTRIRGQLKSFWNSRARLEQELSGGVTVLGSFGGDQEQVTEETKREVDRILAASDPSPQTSLLDLGCGDGRQLAHLCPHFGRVVGVDFADELLELARRRLQQKERSAELIQADVSEFCIDERFDVLLLSGIIPCVDDVQLNQMLGQVRNMSRPDSLLLVRSSIGLTRRIDVVNQFSEDLKARYTAYYRTVEQIQELFEKVGWTCRSEEMLYQHRPDTAVWWFEFERK